MAAKPPFPRHSLGHKANKLAKIAIIGLPRELTRLQEKVRRFRESIGDMPSTSFAFKSFCFYMTLCWIAVIIWEFLISQEFYRDFVGDAFAESVFQFFPFLAIVLIAMLISALVGEPIHPILSPFLVRNSNYIETDEILGVKPPIDKKWLLFTIGIVLAIPMTAFIYFLSSERVDMLLQINENWDVNLTAQRWLPAVLFLVEIATGVFVIYFTQILWFWLGTKRFSTLIDKMQSQIEKTKYDAYELWEAYWREWNHFKNSNGTVSPPVRPCPELQQIIDEFEEGINPSSPSSDSIYSENDEPSHTTSGERANGMHQESDQAEAEQDSSFDIPGNGKSTDDDQDLRRLLDELNRKNHGEL